MGINLKLRDRAGFTLLLWMISLFMNTFIYYAHSNWLIGDGSFFNDFIIEMKRYHVAIFKYTFSNKNVG